MSKLSPLLLLLLMYPSFIKGQENVDPSQSSSLRKYSISFGIITTNGFSSDELVSRFNNSESYTWSDMFSGLHLSFDFPIGKKMALQSFVSYRNYNLAANYEEVPFEGMKHQGYLDRRILFWGLGASAKRFFNDRYRNLYIVGGGQLHFRSRDQEVTFLTNENVRYVQNTFYQGDVTVKYKSIVPTFHLGLGYRKQFIRAFIDLNLGASIKPISLYETFDVGSPIWRRLNLSVGYKL